MTYPKTKTEIVQLILSETRGDPDFSWNDVPSDKIIFDWFVTGRAGAGLRLTDAGAKAFQTAKIAHYDFDFIPPGNTKGASNWGKFTLVLDKKVKCPYYVGIKLIDNNKKQPYIRLYDHKIAMMMTLYGNLESYLESIK